MKKGIKIALILILLIILILVILLFYKKGGVKMSEDIINAQEELTNWLKDPRELGKKPYKIEYVNMIEDEDGIKCYIFKYKTSIFGKYLLGISSESGSYSEMKEFNEKTMNSDALKILNMLKNYWKSVAEQYNNQ